jgi:hypothetical protein
VKFLLAVKELEELELQVRRLKSHPSRSKTTHSVNPLELQLHSPQTIKRMSMFLKGKAKAACGAFGKTDYCRARKATQQALDYELDNYNAASFSDKPLTEPCLSPKRANK